MTSDWLRIISTADLRSISSAIRSGRVKAPFNRISIARFCGSSNVDGTCKGLTHLTETGWTDEQIAYLLESVSESRTTKPSLEDILEIVATGPETSAVPLRDTAVVVGEMFSRANRSVVVVGYAVYQGREVFKKLAERLEDVPDLDVKMFLDVRRPHGVTTTESEILARFLHQFKSKEWPGKRLPEIFYDPRSLSADTHTKASLHAKCIVIDDEEAFISSANFTEAAQVRNIEIGVKIKSPEIAKRLANHFSLLAENHFLQRL